MRMVGLVVLREGTHDIIFAGIDVEEGEWCVRATEWDILSKRGRASIPVGKPLHL
jgi:hypothetical protein